MRTTREWLPARVEYSRLIRLVSAHSLGNRTRTGLMSGCTCDLCRKATDRLEALGAG
jgi:hypothetical protein